jgi:hypothetical protein
VGQDLNTRRDGDGNGDGGYGGGGRRESISSLLSRQSNGLSIYKEDM